MTNDEEARKHLVMWTLQELEYLNKDKIGGLDKYFSVGRVFRYGKQKFWRKRGEHYEIRAAPRTVLDTERCLDSLVGEGRVQRAVVSLGESTDNLKIYRKSIRVFLGDLLKP